jgi:hypothetical protein
MSKTYLLIDDEAESAASTEPYAEAIAEASQGSLEVRSHRPSSIEEVLESIAKTKPDGLLLDIAFTNALMEDRAQLPYDGIALAQQIRTLQTRGSRHGTASLPEFPLVRFSKADVVREYVTGDTTSEDLFDEKVDKADVIEHAESVAKRLDCLAADYPKVSEFAAAEDKSDNALAQLLGQEEEFLARLDARTLLGLRRRDAPAHVLSRYVTGPLLGRPGPLIPEALLAVRLGVDLAQSEDWAAIRESLRSASYQGVFSSGYERWWMALVLDWWATQIDSERAPFRLGAGERVEAIKRKLGLSKVFPIAENPYSPGAKFWHICIASRLPVDPAFGFPLMPEWGQETWHDVDYLCLEEARRDPRNARLGRAERARLAKLRKGDAGA